MWRVLNWIDEFSGYDRTGVRVILALIVFWVLVISAAWGWEELHKPPESHIDTGWVEQYVPRTTPEQIAQDAIDCAISGLHCSTEPEAAPSKSR